MRSHGEGSKSARAQCRHARSRRRQDGLAQGGALRCSRRRTTRPSESVQDQLCQANQESGACVRDALSIQEAARFGDHHGTFETLETYEGSVHMASIDPFVGAEARGAGV